MKRPINNCSTIIEKNKYKQASIFMHIRFYEKISFSKTFFFFLMNNVLNYFSLFYIFSAAILMMFYDYTIRSVMKTVSNVSCFQKYCWISLNNEVLKNVYINQKKKNV